MSKVRDLPEITSLEDDDLVYAVDSSAGTNGGRKIRKDNLKTSVAPSAAETKAAYESNADTNEFTDAEKAKLAGVEAGAAADQDADEVNYDNNASGLSATNVKAAIDEVQANKEAAFSKNTAFNKNFGSAADTVVEGNDERLSTAQRITVKLDPGAGEFSSIKDAVDSISDASSVKPYQVNIGPGVFVEDTISVPSFVFIRGERSATVVRPTDPNDDIFVLNSNCGVSQLKVEGAIGAGASAFSRIGGSTDSTIDLVEFGNNDCLIKVDSTAGSPTMVANSCTIGPNTEFSAGFTLSGTGAGALILNNLTSTISGAGVNPTTLIQGSGSTNKIIATGCNTRVIGPASLGAAVSVEDGISVSLTGFTVIGADIGFSVPNTGDGPEVNVAGLTITETVTNSVSIQNPNTTGFITGAWEFATVSIDQTASGNMDIVFTESNDAAVGLVAYGDILQGLSADKLLNISKLNREEATLGVISGGAITDAVAPFEVDVAAGTGFLTSSGGESIEISWTLNNLAIPANATRYITVNENSVVQAEASLPVDLTQRVILGRVVSGDSQVVRIENASVNLQHHGNQVERYLRNTFGALFASGSILSENAGTDREVDVTAGEYYFGTKMYTPAGGNSITFTTIFRDGISGFAVDSSGTVINNTQYDDNSGTLQNIPSGEYAKGVMLLGGDGAFERYTYVLPQETFALENDAVAADLPQLPASFGDSLTFIAAVIVQEGNPNFVQVLDIRPRPAFAAVASGSASNHGGLTGLSNDDHPQYLLTNGGRALTGNLDMGSNNINNAGTVNGVDVENHASRHLPNGVDPLTTAAPLTNLNGNTANSVGAANSMARSDHTHAIDNATGAVAGLMSASDKTKMDTIESNAKDDQSAAEVPYSNGGSGLAATDVQAAIDETEARVDSAESTLASHLDGGTGKHDASEIDYERADGSKTDIQASSDSIAPAVDDLDDNKLSRTGSQAMTGNLDMGSNDITNAGTLNGIDIASHGSRHNPGGADAIATGTPSTIGANSTNQEGVATSVARSDHTHDLSTGAPSSNLTGDTSNTEGASPNLARADHSHAIDTGAPSSALSASTTNQEGASPNLARADHSHDISTGVVSSQIPAQANAEGASANLARADHTHNIPVGAPSNVSFENLEGSAAAFARQDHVHNVFPAFERVYASNEAIQTTTSTTFVQSLTANIVVPAGGGQYEISWYYEWNFDDAGSDFEAQIQIDNSTTIMEHIQEPKDSAGAGFGGSSQSHNHSGFFEVALAAGSHDIDLDFSSANGATAAIRRRRIKIVRVG